MSEQPSFTPTTPHGLGSPPAAHPGQRARLEPGVRAGAPPQAILRTRSLGRLVTCPGWGLGGRAASAPGLHVPGLMRAELRCPELSSNPWFRSEVARPPISSLPLAAGLLSVPAWDSERFSPRVALQKNSTPSLNCSCCTETLQSDTKSSCRSGGLRQSSGSSAAFC